ncbi:MAG: radical SAM protein [Candidatus Woesearchaeota archaeon]|jgi:pyruvate formate-lyase activating enzyme-like uncharacterized protein|nr:radical SAM protein [Candidatus Woesearchaeota archaeon]
MREIEDTPYYSKKIGELPKGCQMCVKGEKLVLYVTGICPRQCWYCPLSDNRKDQDVIYINEWKTDSFEDMLEEAKLTQAKGAGITGGDPLSRLERTLEYIKFLKEKFGKEFHIHLYTSLILINKDNLKQLYDAGLDEIRFHPDFEKKEEWSKIDLANEFDWDVGVEIPCAPNDKEAILDLCDFIEGKVKFLNLNEFEISDRNSEDMMNEGYDTKTDISHGIKGSDELGLEILEHCENKPYNVHFCTGTLKDKVQMQNRFKLRAQSIATKFDIITDEGLMLRGVIYTKEKDLETLNKTKEMLEEEGLGVMIDEKKLRILTYPEHVQQFAEVLKELSLVPAIIEEDPTVEAFEVNRDFL